MCKKWKSEKNVGRGQLKIDSPTNKASGRPSLSLVMKFQYVKIKPKESNFIKKNIQICKENMEKENGEKSCPPASGMFT